MVLTRKVETSTSSTAPESRKGTVFLLPCRLTIPQTESKVATEHGCWCTPVISRGMHGSTTAKVRSRGPSVVRLC